MPTHYEGTDQEVLALNTFIKFSRAAESLAARLARSDTTGGLTTSQFGVLESLFHLGPMSQSAICTKLLKSGGNITLVIDNLEREGLVQRERNPEDRRVVMVLLTDRGRELIERIFPGHVVAIVNEMQVLKPDEQETLGYLCRKLGKQELGSEADE
jgi:MarR family 2-MHQ and catechol resistance regulon transcriptional repressor